MEVFATHPWLPKRVLAMRVFAESEIYRTAVGLEGRALDDRGGRRAWRALLKGDA